MATPFAYIPLRPRRYVLSPLLAIMQRRLAFLGVIDSSLPLVFKIPSKMILIHGVNLLRGIW
ncbi:MAG: hypothetical protein A2992_04395 [Elusimicrobia bacterium RIFCSPLOWO2_01_FULL_59_12]|nr:MAG: hypothetical protein A2992_04395 [Elusimicrobia bacterium RIFCSPLOWO2_01_FULL_59_12]